MMPPIAAWRTLERSGRGVTFPLPRGPMESDCSGAATHSILAAPPTPERFSAGILFGCRDGRRAGRPDTLRTLPPVSKGGGAYSQFAETAEPVPSGECLPAKMQATFG